MLYVKNKSFSLFKKRILAILEQKMFYHQLLSNYINIHLILAKTVKYETFDVLYLSKAIINS